VDKKRQLVVTRMAWRCTSLLVTSWRTLQ